MPTLQGVDLSKSYRGRKVVDNVELEIGQGEVVGLLGPNGAGKTTTFYMIVGLARPDAERDQLSAPGTLGFPSAYQRRKSSGSTRNPPVDAGATTGQARGVAGADGPRDGAPQQGLHAIWRRTQAA